MLHLLLLLMIGMVKRQVHKGKQLQATILMTDLKERSTLSKKTHQVELPNTTNAAEKSEVTDNYFKFYSQTCNFYKKTTLNLLPILKSAHCVLFQAALVFNLFNNSIHRSHFYYYIMVFRLIFLFIRLIYSLIIPQFFFNRDFFQTF